MIENIHDKLSKEFAISSTFGPIRNSNFKNEVTEEIRNLVNSQPLDVAVVSFLNHVLERMFISTMSMQENNFPSGGMFFPVTNTLPRSIYPSVVHRHNVDKVSENPFPENFAEKAPVAHKSISNKGTYVNMFAEDISNEIQEGKYSQPKSGIRHNYEHIVNEAANKYGVDPNLVHAVIRAESAGNPKAVSPVGARGLMQLMPGTARDLGVTDSFDPEQNIMGGTKYLSQLLNRYRGNHRLALAAYNWGMGNVEKRPERMPSETRNYVSTVDRYYKELG